MSLNKKLFSFMFLIGLVLSLPVYANDLDDECKTFCTNNSFEDGHYLAPEPDAACKEGYEKNTDNDICCCKPKTDEEQAEPAQE